MHEDKAPESAWEHSRWRRSARLLWRSPTEQDDVAGKPLGLWLTDDTVAIVHADRVQAHRATTGEPLWTWRPPDGQIVGRASAATEDGVGTVLHHDDEILGVESVGVTSLAVDTGEVLRHREQDTEPLGFLPSETAIGSGLVAAAVASLKGDELTLRTLDVDTGGTRRELTLRDRRFSEPSVVGARPFVARVRARGARGGPRLLVLDDYRKEPLPLALPAGQDRFGKRIAVTGDVLAVELPPAHEDAGACLGAFSLSSGELLWEWRSKGGYLVPVAHRGWLLVLHRYGRRLSVLDPADGRVVARRRLRGDAFDPLLAASGDVIAVGCGYSRGTRRLRVFRWR